MMVDWLLNGVYTVLLLGLLWILTWDSGVYAYSSTRPR